MQPFSEQSWGDSFGFLIDFRLRFFCNRFRFWGCCCFLLFVRLLLFLRSAFVPGIFGWCSASTQDLPHFLRRLLRGRLSSSSAWSCCVLQKWWWPAVPLGPRFFCTSSAWNDPTCSISCFLILHHRQIVYRWSDYGLGWPDPRSIRGSFQKQGLLQIEASESSALQACSVPWRVQNSHRRHKRSSLCFLWEVGRWFYWCVKIGMFSISDLILFGCMEKFLISRQPHRHHFFGFFCFCFTSGYLQFPQLMSLDPDSLSVWTSSARGFWIVLSRSGIGFGFALLRRGPRFITFCASSATVAGSKFSTQNPELLLLVLRKFLCFAVLRFSTFSVFSAQFQLLFNAQLFLILIRGDIDFVSDQFWQVRRLPCRPMARESWLVATTTSISLFSSSISMLSISARTRGVTGVGFDFFLYGRYRSFLHGVRWRWSRRLHACPHSADWIDFIIRGIDEIFAASRVPWRHVQFWRCHQKFPELPFRTSWPANRDGFVWWSLRSFCGCCWHPTERHGCGANPNYSLGSAPAKKVGFRPVP